MIRSLLIVLVLLLPHLGWATAQTPDWLIDHGDTLALYSAPLEQWLDKLPLRPAELRGNSSTACGRGYEATWQLADNHLYLLDVQPCGGKPLTAAVLKKWFGGDGHARIPATWVTGQLDVVRGKLLRYVHMGYESIYEQDWLLTFAEGKLVRQQLFNNYGCQDDGPPGGAKAFQAQLLQAIDWHRVPVASLRRRVFIEFRPDSTGRRCQVRLLKGTGAPLDSLALAAARTVAAANWGACYRFGRWLPMVWTAPVTFDEENRRRYQPPSKKPAR